MEVIFFQPEPRVNARHEDSEFQPMRCSANKRLAAAAALLARSCFIVSIQLNLLFATSRIFFLCSRDSCAKE
jgi:hypothetical protein